MSNDPHKSEPYMTHQISTMLDQQYLWNKDKQLIKEPMYQDKHLQDGRWDKNEDEVYIVLNEKIIIYFIKTIQITFLRLIQCLGNYKI